ncbi:hypothetical protein V6N13_026086 [Hibiscus sabdariffa]
MTNQQNVAVLDVKSRGLRSLLPPSSSLPVAKSFSPTDFKMLLKKRFETEKGGARINAWVDSMRASSPTRVRSTDPTMLETDDKSSWIVGSYFSLLHLGLLMSYHFRLASARASGRPF